MFESRGGEIAVSHQPSSKAYAGCGYSIRSARRSHPIRRPAVAGSPWGGDARGLSLTRLGRIRRANDAGSGHECKAELIDASGRDPDSLGQPNGAGCDHEHLTNLQDRLVNVERHSHLRRDDRAKEWNALAQGQISRALERLSTNG